MIYNWIEIEPDAPSKKGDVAFNGDDFDDHLLSSIKSTCVDEVTEGYTDGFVICGFQPRSLEVLRKQENLPNLRLFRKKTSIQDLISQKFITPHKIKYPASLDSAPSLSDCATFSAVYESSLDTGPWAFTMPEPEKVYYHRLGLGDVIKEGDIRARSKFIILDYNVKKYDIDEDYFGKKVYDCPWGSQWTIWRPSSEPGPARLPMNPYYSTPLPLP